ncbi:aspartate-semialdehyde dehydrogenase [Denitrobacterium detoxificans]|uniref:Aspartate-semialdehyde dehydrogenase n=1 Tax=Denitrobacterium detoxificans TaxID=79604 RepID=A0A172S0N9_9ACTN|nr:aspartate-semialdehyde dehydrogenase [Denitrobacterium detoxificans]ANE23423.1 aspartate-semialdehyde dehydrogenase [Denitrobacterium detoxificans]SEO83425.1 aspartate-semialdehyde dehydrogenase [Denitrobacterium detoxificans]
MAWTKEMPANPVVAVCGATGAVGQEFLKVLHDVNFPASEVRALASARSAGKEVPFEGCGLQKPGNLVVQEMTPESFQGVDIALFSAGASVSKQLREAVVAAGAVMIDNSSAFRMDEDVPLVVPEVNPEDVAWHNGVIANPNCSTIEMVVALKPLAEIAPIKRVVVSTYQAASGAGMPAMLEVQEQTRQYLANEPMKAEAFAHPLAFNCIPRIDVMLEDGSTKEEWKMVVETKKIMHAPEVGVSATCVRVPVIRCHGESLNVEFEAPVSVQAAYDAWKAAPMIEVMDDPAQDVYPMPGALAGTDPVYVGRVREDASVQNGLNFWLVMDQIRKGAALNAVQIAQLLLP